MPPITYKKAGVDIDKADTFIKSIKLLLEKSKRPEVLGRIGGFSGLFMPRLSGMRNPVLVSFVPKLELPYRGLGSGIPRMIEECRKAKLTEPELIEDKISETFRVTFHRPGD